MMNSRGGSLYTGFAVVLLSMMVLFSGCTEQYTKPEPRTSLLNTMWRAAEIYGKKVVFMPGQKLDVSLVLYQGGHIRGSTGCNTFIGAYDRNADHLSFSSIGRSAMACSSEISARERAFLKALREVSRYSISGRTLKLFNKDGLKVLEMIAVRVP
jgi:heat shock protein HslJ